MKIPENLWLQDIKKTEYIFLAVKSIAVILLITYVFYESFLPIFFMIPIWVIYARDGLRDLCRKKEKEFRVQFSNAIQAMGAALKAGYSVENAIREAEKDLATNCLSFEQRSILMRWLTSPLDADCCVWLSVGCGIRERSCQIVPPQETFKICIPLQIARTGFREARTRFMRRI